MGCSQMKQKKQRPLQDSQGIADSQNTQHHKNPVNNQQANSYKIDEIQFIQSQSKVLHSQEPQNDKIQNILSSQVYRETREIKKNIYKAQTIVNLLGEDKECYRLRDDYLLGSFGNTSTFSSPLKKQLVQKENKSMKTLKRKISDSLVNIF